MAQGASSAGSQVRIKSELEATTRLNSTAMIAILVHIRQSPGTVTKVVCSAATTRPHDSQITSIVATSVVALMTGIVHVEVGTALISAELLDVATTVPLLSSKAALCGDGWNGHDEDGRKRDEFGEHVISYARAVGASSSRLKRCEL